VSTLEECAPWDDLRGLRVSAVRFGVQASACTGAGQPEGWDPNLGQM